jgi:hypothetical protein
VAVYRGDGAALHNPPRQAGRGHEAGDAHEHLGYLS